jgi:hypothetical protein
MKYFIPPRIFSAELWRSSFNPHTRTRSWKFAEGGLKKLLAKRARFVRLNRYRVAASGERSGMFVVNSRRVLLEYGGGDRHAGDCPLRAVYTIRAATLESTLRQAGHRLTLGLIAGAAGLANGGLFVRQVKGTGV